MDFEKSFKLHEVDCGCLKEEDGFFLQLLLVKWFSFTLSPLYLRMQL